MPRRLQERCFCCSLEHNQHGKRHVSSERGEPPPPGSQGEPTESCVASLCVCVCVGGGGAPPFVVLERPA